MFTKTPIPEVKLTVIGRSPSGKTALISRYVDERFPEPEKTIGVLSSPKVVTVGKREIKLDIWDTPGEERYQFYLAPALRGSQGVLICFSVNDRHSFEQVESLFKLAQEECEKDLYILLIGTKCDKKEDSDQYGKREVEYDEAKLFAQGHGWSYIETSAKERINVSETFELAGKEMLEKSEKSDSSSCSMF